MNNRRSFIIGIKSTRLSVKEKIFIKRYKPWGVILFTRNIRNIHQSQKLTSSIVADIEVLKSHSTTIKPGYQPVMHVQNIRTSVTIIDIQKKSNSRNKEIDPNDKTLRTGDIADVHLNICFDKQYIKNGSSVLLCEGRTKVVGTITSISEN